MKFCYFCCYYFDRVLDDPSRHFNFLISLKLLLLLACSLVLFKSLVMFAFIVFVCYGRVAVGKQSNELFIIIISSSNSSDRLCGLVVRVPGYNSRGTGSIPGASRFSEKYWVWNGVYSTS
jgi:hypothetical protein